MALPELRIFQRTITLFYLALKLAVIIMLGCRHPEINYHRISTSQMALPELRIFQRTITLFYLALKLAVIIMSGCRHLTLMMSSS